LILAFASSRRGFLAAIAWSDFSLLEYSDVITAVFGPVRVQSNTAASGKFEGALGLVGRDQFVDIFFGLILK